MKTTLPYFALLAILGSAFAGDGIVTSTRTYQATDSGARGGRMKDAGTPGAIYHSNFPGNAIVLLNKTPEYVTFFIYFADMRGPNDVDEMIRLRCASLSERRFALSERNEQYEGVLLLGQFKAGKMENRSGGAPIGFLLVPSRAGPGNSIA